MSAKAQGFATFVLRVRASRPDPKVLRTVEEVDRSVYVASEDVGRAYSDHMLPLACGQATERLDDAVMLLSALDVRPHHRVLELGTGSGFVTELLSRLAAKVVTVDRYRRLLSAARERHAKRGLSNVTYLQRDATALPDLDGPFDRIVSSVAFEAPPRAFIEHLVADGVLVAPIGPPDGPQTISWLGKVGARFERREAGEGWFPPAETGVAHAT